MFRITETQRIQIRNRPCAHREYIAQNTADARCSPLIRFDVRRVIMAFDLEIRR
jgi:hypothetical protein